MNPSTISPSEFLESAVADVIELGNLRWGDCPGLSGWPSVIKGSLSKGLYQGRWRVDDKWDMVRIKAVQQQKQKESGRCHAPGFKDGGWAISQGILAAC